MKRYVLWAVLAVILAAGPVGCGKKEIEALNTKVTELQKNVSDAKDQLAEKTKETDDLHAKVGQLQATVDAQAAELPPGEGHRLPRSHQASFPCLCARTGRARLGESTRSVPALPRMRNHSTRQISASRWSGLRSGVDRRPR
jgi:septal ring factor EnvC (AmiA/AmiB activator)